MMTIEETARLMELPLEELERRAKVGFRLLPDTLWLLADFAQAIVDEIRARNATGELTRLIVPVGPIAHYRQAVDISNRERISWRQVHLFAMDEFLDWQGRPIPVEHALSFEGFLRRHLVGELDADLRPAPDQLVVPHPFRIGEASEKIAALGGIDCCYGGIGYHGHIAFNEPPLSRWHRISVEQLRQSETRVVVLGDDSIVVQSIHSAGGNSSAIPPMAVTLGMKDILAARKLRLYCAAGERHRAIFRLTVAGEVCVEYPSTLIQGHPDALVMTDVATAQPIAVGLR